MSEKQKMFDKDFYSDLVEHASDLVQCVNTAGEFVYVNKSWKAKLNYTDSDLKSLRLWDIIHPDSLAHCQQTFQQVLSGCHAGLVEAVFLTSNGEKLLVEGVVNCRLDAVGNVISTQGIFRDVSLQKEKEQQIRNQAKIVEEQFKLQKLLSQVTANFNKASLDNFDEQVNQALKLFGEYVSADRVYVFDYDFDRGVCHNTFEWCQDGISPEIDNLQNVPLEIMTDWVETHSAGQTIYIPDVLALDPEDGVRILLEPQGVKSLITFPMMDRDRCEGFVGFDSVRTHHHYTHNEEQILWQLSTNIRNVTTRVNLTRKLQESEKRFRRLFQEVPSIAMQGFQPDGTVSYWNQASEALFGYSADEATGRNIVDLIIPDFMKAQVEKQIQVMTSGEKRIISGELTLKHKTGSLIPVFSSHIVLAYADQRKEMFWLGIDLRAQKQIEEQRTIELELFRTTLLAIADGLISTDEKGRIVIMNAIAEQLTGWSKSQAVGKPIREVYVRVDEFSKKRLDDPADFFLKTGEEYLPADNTLLVSKDGTETPVDEKYSLIRNPDGKNAGMVFVFRDVTKKREEQKMIEHLSFRDQLTGLYNRRYIEDAIARLDTNRHLPFSIATMDVNVLKLINDAFGHQKGDCLLKIVAEIISNSVRSDDIVGRMGGDEFILLLPKTNASEAEMITQRIVDLASQTSVNSVAVSLSAGFAVKTSQDEEISSVIERADNNMYMVKIIHGKAKQRQIFEDLTRQFHNQYEREQIHAEKVERYAALIARALNFSDSEVVDIKTAAFLHDIGKLVIPPRIYNKQDTLTKEDWQIIQQHPRSGYQMLKNVVDYAEYAEWVLYHHERWDGQGYPIGLMGEEIPICARIIAVADAYAAMTVDRNYQASFSNQAALKELKKCSDSQFDPQIVEVFVWLVGGEGLS